MLIITRHNIIHLNYSPIIFARAFQLIIKNEIHEPTMPNNAALAPAAQVF